jgi:hypothetical protein
MFAHAPDLSRAVVATSDAPIPLSAVALQTVGGMGSAANANLCVATSFAVGAVLTGCQKHGVYATPSVLVS